MKNFVKINSGFTLIELLVVIAIISLLSSIIFASVKNARTKAIDARIKSDMLQMRNQAETFAILHGSYYGSKSTGWGNDDIAQCTTDASDTPPGIGTGGTLLDPLINESIAKFENAIFNDSQFIGARIFCGVGDSSHDSWAFAAPINNPPAGYNGWCVDSNGASKPVNLDFTAATGGGNRVGGQNVFAICP